MFTKYQFAKLQFVQHYILYKIAFFTKYHFYINQREGAPNILSEAPWARFVVVVSAAFPAGLAHGDRMNRT